ncbi:hypothetical protein ALC57_15079 [Trachymyrmex cornetzi]|uniref:Uncharacterized protein n=1 Tax=Trachymyrmex cornetzi TaxID=471704 RepID=A0A151IXF5_9HYME|nr:hypothetical protein ALC57_15079 [Trachymyrmex cornetzi]
MPPKDSGEATRNPSLQGACEIPDNNSRRLVRGRYHCGSCEIDRLSNETASERQELLNWVRKRENAGAAIPCKRKIYKLESPIKSVPAVTTSPLSPFHVERRLFVSFLFPLPPDAISANRSFRESSR